MPTLLYPVLAEWDDDAMAWSVLAPDFPEIASSCRASDDVAAVASAAIWTAVEARRGGGLGLPEPTTDIGPAVAHWPTAGRNRVVHVPVVLDDEPGRTSGINRG